MKTKGQITVEFMTIIVVLTLLLLVSISIFNEKNSGFILSKENYNNKLTANKVALTINHLILAGNGTDVNIILNKYPEKEVVFSGNAVQVKWRKNFVDAALLTKVSSATALPLGEEINFKNQNGTIIVKEKNLLSFWPFDEGGGIIINDYSNGYTGAVNGADWNNGISGTALEFNDGSEYAELPRIITSNTGTLLFWFKPNDLTGQTLFDASTASKYFFVDIDNSGYLRFWHEDSTDADFQDARYNISSLSTEEWHLVTAIWKFNGSPATQLYLDGYKVDEDLDSAGNIPTFLTPYIGETRSNYASTWTYNGLIDEMRIYDKELTASEIENYYLNTKH